MLQSYGLHVSTIQAQEMGLLGAQQDGGEAGAEGTSAIMADTPSKAKEGAGRYQLPISEDDSGSDSGSGAETDDEQSSTSDYPPPPQQLGQPTVVATATNSRDTISSQENSCAAMNQRPQDQDTPKEESSVLIEVSGTEFLLPTAQLRKKPEDVDRARESESSNGGNEPDVSCSESEGGGYRLSQDLSSVPQTRLLQLPTSRLTAAAAKHDDDHSSESESESSSVDSAIEGELEDLSLQNKLHRPHRDRADGSRHTADSSSIASTTLTTTTNSYLYGENASDRVRHLVKRSVSKKKKQLQRQTRPRKETKAPTPAGRRSKKTNRNVLKHSVDVSIY